ncbi:MAG TPA: YgiQ family radical SAM protein [Clostridiales bacterium]|jgi:uncharacterized radical SAM protein YgiQ|nr:YgiQ family radical SAM protein [Clostridiales bacterium]
MSFLPVNYEEVKERGWGAPDFVFVSGDAYVDHPSFGTALISRLLESRGYKVAILAQPDWKSEKDFKRFGRPRLGFLITAGNVDSMVNHYTVFRRRRSNDSYSPGGRPGRRPDRASIVYSRLAKAAWPDVPVVLGGLEASLRRLGHYDYWDGRVRPSILLDAEADLLVYGMGERALIEIAEALAGGIQAADIAWIPGTACRIRLEAGRPPGLPDDYVVRLPAFRTIESDPAAYAKSFRLQYQNQNWAGGKTLIEEYDDDLAVQVNPPQPPLATIDLDDLYELPYMRAAHPQYDEAGGVPALIEVLFSITAHRGCFGGCAFCALTFHQGRDVRGRSRESIVREARRMTEDPRFKGYIHDIGGPTANFHRPACPKQEERGSCVDRDCLFPRPCPNLDISHREYLEILREVRALPGVKKVFIRSGIRFDYLIADSDTTFLNELCRHHISGLLKVAPEHAAPSVLRRMRKPEIEVFKEFSRRYRAANQKLSKKQYLIPYLISSHPGSTLDQAVELALFQKEHNLSPEQVQDFYPTPGTLSTCMYHSGIDPLTGEAVFVPKKLSEKRLQRAMLQLNKAANRRSVRQALGAAGRSDLIAKLFPGERKVLHEPDRKTAGDRKAKPGRIRKRSR